MSNGIKILLAPPSYDKGLPKSLPYANGSGYLPFPLDKFQRDMRASFSAAGLKIVDGFFDRKSKYYPKHLDMLVLAIEAAPDFFNGVPAYDIGRVYGMSYEIVGSIIAERERIGEFEFHYYTKVFVIEELWNSGLAGKMIHAIKEMKIPGMLKTSKPENHARYAKHSDITEKIGPYYFHGFDFVDKKTGQEKFLGARSKFYAAARHIVENKPVTALPVQSEVAMNSNLPLFPNQNLY